MIKYLPDSNSLKTEIRKSWPRESKAFSTSIVTRNPSLFNKSLISFMLQINLPLPPTNLFFLHKEFVERKLTLAK